MERGLGQVGIDLFDLGWDERIEEVAGLTPQDEAGAPLKAEMVIGREARRCTSSAESSSIGARSRGWAQCKESLGCELGLRTHEQ